MSEQSSSYSVKQRFVIRDAVEKSMWARGWNRKKLAGEVGLSLDTVNRALSATNPDITDKTLFLFEDVLGESFRKFPAIVADAEAHEALGGYSRKRASRFFGEYVCVRPTFGDPETLTAYVIDLAWNDAERCMAFHEKERPDPEFTQSGPVHMPDGLPYMSLMTMGSGDVRHILLCKPLHPNEGLVLRGLIQTLFKNGGVLYKPVSAPIVLYRPGGERPKLGVITKQDADYKTYRMLLDGTLKEYVDQLS